jgi:hypothetical protein
LGVDCCVCGVGGGGVVGGCDRSTLSVAVLGWGGVWWNNGDTFASCDRLVNGSSPRDASCAAGHFMDVLEAESIEARFRGRTNPTVLRIIDEWWRTALASEALEGADAHPLPRGPFVRMMSKIHRALIEEGEQWEMSDAASFANTLWEEYARADELSRTSFADVLFELVRTRHARRTRSTPLHCRSRTKQRRILDRRCDRRTGGVVPRRWRSAPPSSVPSSRASRVRHRLSSGRCGDPTSRSPASAGATTTSAARPRRAARSRSRRSTAPSSSSRSRKSVERCGMPSTHSGRWRSDGAAQPSRCSEPCAPRTTAAAHRAAATHSQRSPAC